MDVVPGWVSALSLR